MDKIENLKEKLNILEGQIDKYQQRLLKEGDYLTYPFPNEKRRKLEKKIWELEYEVIKIKKIIEVDSTTPIISGELVDLHKNDENPKGNYIVCLHNSKTIIGEVGCNGTNNNIHYVIDTEYQNNGYGFQAVVLMLNYLISNNFENIEIYIEKENIYSIKLVEKLRIFFPVFNKNESEHYISYYFNLSQKKAEKNNVSR